MKPLRSNDHAKNSILSLIDYAVLPFLLLAMTPVLIRNFGAERYGLWSLLLSLVGFSTLLNFGFADATTKFVAELRGRDNASEARETVAISLAIYLALASVSGIALFFVLPRLIGWPIRVSGGLVDDARLAMQVSAVIFGLRIVESDLSASLWGFERYDFATGARILLKGTIVGAAVLASVGTRSVADAMTMTCVGYALGCSIEYGLLVVVLGKPLFPKMGLGRARSMARFAILTWTQNASGLIFSQADKIMIGTILGVTQLGYYTVAVQIAQQIHSLIAAGASFVFPLASRVSAGKMAKEDARGLYVRTTIFVALAASILTLGVVLFSRELVVAWVGESIGSNVSVLTVLLAFAYGLFAVNAIAPFYILNGTGRAGVQAVLSGTSASLMVLSLLVLVKRLGLVGAALARLPDAVVRAMAIRELNRRIFGVPQWFHVTHAIIPFLASTSVGMAVSLFGAPLGFLLSLPQLSLKGIVFIVVGAGVALLYRRFIVESRELVAGIPR